MRRTNRFVVRLSDSELKTLHSLTKNAGFKTPTEYFRHQCLGKIVHTEKEKHCNIVHTPKESPIVPEENKEPEPKPVNAPRIAFLDP